MRFRLLITAGLLSGLLTGCSFTSVEELEEAAKPCDTTNVTFSGTILPILERACSDTLFGNCHYAGSTNGDFTTFDGIEFYASDDDYLKKWVVDNTWMPPSFGSGPPISDCDRRAFDRWIKEGYPNN